MAQSAKSFFNVVLCEDIRDEIGNKKSLMGVLAGDVSVPSFPASIQLALFFQYFPKEDDADEISIVVRFVDDRTEMMRAKTAKTARHQGNITVGIPKGVATFEKETTFRIFASVNDGPEQEILTKKVMIGPVV